MNDPRRFGGGINDVTRRRRPAVGDKTNATDRQEDGTRMSCQSDWQLFEPEIGPRTGVTLPDHRR